MSFGALDPAAKVIEKRSKVHQKEHGDLQEIAFELASRGGSVDELQFARRMHARRWRSSRMLPSSSD
jgi:hypothetical protein